MKSPALLLACLAAFHLAARADDAPLSASQIATMEHHGWVTPQFEAAAHQLIEAKEDALQAQADQAKLQAEQPALEKEAAAEETQVAQLKAELARYDHPDETDFATLQDAMKNASADPQDQLALAQAYVWTYPASPHATEATGDLQQIEKKIADQTQATQNAEAARLAAQARLLQRVQARDLSLAEWRAFLQDKSQAEVVQYLGQPSSQQDEYWIYTGAWTHDPETGQKVGLQLNFNGGRVLSVAPATAP
jgi:hypothetical protein